MSEKIENNEFDKHIQNKYANHGVTPPEQLWSKINYEASQLETTHLKKRIVFYRWLSAAAAVLLIGISSMYIAHLNDKSIHQISLNSTISNKTPLIDNNKEIMVNQIPANKKLTEGEGIAEITTKSEQPSGTETASNKSKERTLYNSKKVQNQSITTTAPPNKKITPIVNPPKHNPLIQKTTEKDFMLEKETNQPLIAEQQKESKVIPNNKSTTTESLNSAQNKKESVLETNPIVTTDPSEENKTIEPQTSSSNKKELLAKENVPFKESAEKQPLLAEEKIKDKEPQDSSIQNRDNSSAANVDLPPITPETPLSKISISAFFSPTYASRSLKGASADFYNTHQNGSLTYNAGIDVGYHPSENWNIRVGINYSSLTQEFKIENVSPSILPINIDTINEVITVNSSLGTTEIEDIEELGLEDDDDHVFLFNYKEKQNYTFLNVPLFVEYELGKKKLRISFQMGLTANVTVKSHSKIKIKNLDNGNDVAIENFGKTKSFNLSGAIGMGLKYHFNKKIALFVIPNYTASFTNLSNDKANQIKPYFINFSTGLQFRF